MSVGDLIKKGDGVLTKRGDVWTYPGCANDPRATNLVLPVEYVSDAEVQAALVEGTLSAAVMSPTGAVTSVRVYDENAGPALQAAHAGSPEAGTELPPGSRVEYDAGMHRDAPEQTGAVAPKAAGETASRPEAKVERTSDQKAKR